MKPFKYYQGHALVLRAAVKPDEPVSQAERRVRALALVLHERLRGVNGDNASIASALLNLAMITSIGFAGRDETRRAVLLFLDEQDELERRSRS